MLGQFRTCQLWPKTFQRIQHLFINMHILWLSMALMTMVGCSTLPSSYHPTNAILANNFSHDLFDQTLRAHVRNGTVNYPDYASDSRFTQYIKQLNRLDPTTLPTQKNRLAFWINAYNAFAVKGILDGYSPRTWTDKYTYFVSRDYMVGGAKVNLYAVERKILIPQFLEPRIHFAIVCASQSCPKLQSAAYTPEGLEEQLTNSAKQFINDPSRNRFDSQRKIAYLSMIFDWFEEDFTNHSGTLLKYVAQFVANDQLAQELRTTPYTIKFLEYDWELNGIALQPQT